jgi:hypothetical protein
MKAIATIAALLCSVTLSLAQTTPGKASKPGGAPAAVTQVQSEPADVQKAQPEEFNLLNLVQEGGWAMIPLGGLSVITVSLILVFLVTIRRGAIVSRQYLNTVEVLIRKRDYLGVLAVSNRHGEALARVVQRASTGWPISRISGFWPRWWVCLVRWWGLSVRLQR